MSRLNKDFSFIHQDIRDSLNDNKLEDLRTLLKRVANSIDVQPTERKKDEII